MKKKKIKTPDEDYQIPVPLGTYLSSADDHYILESLKLISLRSKWSVNEATLALKAACEKEWRNRYGEKDIPDIPLSEEALQQLRLDQRSENGQS